LTNERQIARMKFQRMVMVEQQMIFCQLYTFSVRRQLWTKQLLS